MQTLRSTSRKLRRLPLDIRIALAITTVLCVLVAVVISHGAQSIVYKPQVRSATASTESLNPSAERLPALATEWGKNSIAAEELFADCEHQSGNCSPAHQNKIMIVRGKVKNIKWNGTQPSVEFFIGDGKDGNLGCQIRKDDDASIELVRDLDYTKDAYLAGRLLPLSLATPNYTLTIVGFTDCHILPFGLLTHDPKGTPFSKALQKQMNDHPSLSLDDR